MSAPTLPDGVNELAAAPQAPALASAKPAAPAKPRPSIHPIQDAELREFAHFLHEHLNRQRSPTVWLDDFRRSHRPESPNYGFALRDAGQLVGGIGALYADRLINGKQERFCNITSWCVLNAYRQHSTRLAMAVLGQGERVYTDFSPTEVVGSTLRFLKFTELDDRRAVTVNLPGWQPGWQVHRTADAIRSRLQGEALNDFNTHLQHPWLEHALLGDGQHWCYVIYRRTRIRGLPAAQVLHVGDAALYSRGFRSLASHWLGQGLPISIVECRFIAKPGWPSVVQAGAKRKLVRSTTLPAATVDYLYSESLAFDLV